MDTDKTSLEPQNPAVLEGAVSGTCHECKCCSTAWHECEHCGGEGGRDGDELMEEDPLWYSQDDHEECDVCEGKGGWNVCIGECVNGKHEH